MKYIIPLCISILLLYSCKNETNFFEVKGTIANASGKKVTLQWLTFGSKAPIVLATDTIKPNGLFIVRTPKNNTEDIYLLTVENGPDFYLINDVSSITIKADVNQYKQYTTAESAASTALHEFLQAYTEQYPTVKNAIYISDSVYNTTSTDSIKNVYINAKNKAVTNINQLIKQYCNNNNSPALEAYLITKAMATMPATEVKLLLDKANKKYNNNQHLKVLNVLLQSSVAKKKIEPTIDTVKRKDTSLNGSSLIQNKPIKDTLIKQ